MARNIVKQGPNFKVYDDGTILIEKVRASYPHLAKPYKGKDDKGEAKYGIVLLLPKATHKAAKDAAREMGLELLKENKIKDLASDKKFLRDGDQAGKEDYEGHYLISARETRRPALRDAKAQRVDADEAGEMFYGGCWVSALIRPWFQNNSYGKRLNAGLSAVQFFKNDEPFGEGRLSDEDVDDTFESYEDGDGDDASGYDDDDDI